MTALKLSSKLFLAAFVLLIITNIVVLWGVYINRTSETTSHITLTQRELKLPYSMQKENNSISLKLTYRTINKLNNSHQDNWLNIVKLKELGFDTNKYLNSIQSIGTQTKEVFIVLENDGESYEKSLKSTEESLAEKEALYNANKDNKSKQRGYENAKNNLTREQISQSRLFAIDAGLDYKKLRQKYANKTNYIIVKGLVKPFKEHKQKILYGYIQQLNIQTMHLPYKFKRVLKGVKPINNYKYTQNNSPKYKVEVKYGSRYEPWITNVKKIY